MSDRERAALIRLAIVCAAWALGEAVAWQAGATAMGPVVGAILGAAAYLATRDGEGGGSEPRYWRGRRIDGDRWRR